MSDDLIQQTTDAIAQIHSFDLEKLARRDLGGMEFGVAVAPAQRLISLFKMIPVDAVRELPKPALERVRDQANSALTRFNEFANFDIANFNGNVVQWRDGKANDLREAYDGFANNLMQPISFLAARRTDFQALEIEAKRVIAEIKKERESLLDALQGAKADADSISEAMRKAAADVGVTQEAVHFANQAQDHEDRSAKWLVASIVLSIVIALYSVASLFITRIFVPENSYEMVQIAISKILIFAVIAYMLVVSVRNYNAHKHNNVVNRHRQNALQTYKALAAAAHLQEAQDIVLTHAAACIYSPQESGYTKVGTGNQPAGLIEMLPRLASTPAPHN